jgi:hypothetical protein
MAIKERRTELKRAWEAEDMQLEAAQSKLKAAMLHVMNVTGGDSVRTSHGTIIRTLKIKPSAADWSAIYGWIVENPERFELLEKRVKSTFVSQYMDEHEGQLPPGVNVHQEYEISVRRPTAG